VKQMAGGQAFAVRAELRDITALEGEEFLAGLGVPDFHFDVVGTRKAFAVPTENDRTSALEGEKHLASLNVPHLDLAWDPPGLRQGSFISVTTTGGQAVAVGAEHHAVEDGGLLQSQEFLAGLRVPHLHFTWDALAVLISAAPHSGQAFAVGAEDDP